MVRLIIYTHEVNSFVPGPAVHQSPLSDCRSCSFAQRGGVGVPGFEPGQSPGSFSRTLAAQARGPQGSREVERCEVRQVIYEFDVGITTHDLLKGGAVVDTWINVQVENDCPVDAALMASQMGACHGYVTACLDRNDWIEPIKERSGPDELIIRPMHDLA